MTVTSGHGRLGIGEDELGAAADDALPLLVGAGQEPRNVDEGQDGDVEGIAGADEASGLLGGRDVEGARHGQRLVGDDADGVSLDVPKADDDVGGV